MIILQLVQFVCILIVLDIFFYILSKEILNLHKKIDELNAKIDELLNKD